MAAQSNDEVPDASPPDPPMTLASGEVADAVLVTADFASRYGDALDAIGCRRPMVIIDEEVPSAAELARVEIANFWLYDWVRGARPYIGAATRAPNLRWFHSMSAGVDAPFFGALVSRGVRLTTSSGASAVSIAHHVLMTMLALARDFPATLRAQDARTWRSSTFGDDLEGARVLIVGLGPIGLEVGRLAQAFAMDVTGVRRTPTGTEGFPVHRLFELDRLIPDADWVVLALPLTDTTTHILSAERMAACRPSVRIVNVGRGGLIDEPALIAALQSGRIGGAALDVFAAEPLPESSPLWTLPNLIVTPHMSAAVPATRHRQAMAFVENLARYDAGLALTNEVGGPALVP